MTPKVKNLAAKLNKIENDIDSLNLNDHRAWEKISQKLEKTIPPLPKDRTDLKELIHLAAQAAVVLAQGAVSDRLAIADAVYEALNTAEQCLKGSQDGEESVVGSRRILEDLLDKMQTVAPDTAVEPEPVEASSSFTLNDAAALLIQIEPDNQAELAGLRAVLDKLATNDEYTETCRNFITQANAKLSNMMDVNVSDPDQSLSEIGALLEEAMNSSDGSSDCVLQPKDESPEEVNDSETEDPMKNYMPEDAEADLLGEYIAECKDLISNAEEALLSLETDPEDMDAVGGVFRAFHTVKGTSAFLELTLISELGHHAESLLSRVRDGEIRYSGGYADLSLRALDMIKELIAAVQEALAGNPLLKPDGYNELLNVLKDPEAAGVSAEIDDIVAPRIGDILVAQGIADRRDIETAAETHPQEKLGVAIAKTGIASVKDVGQALRTQKRIRSSGQAMESAVRVSTQRLDRLIDMVGELVIAHSMVAQDTQVFNANNHELAKKVSHTSKIVRELQDISMSMRMVPMKATFNKMARLVRDVARKVGKNVNFSTEGEDTEIDRNLVDIINDPLVHMVRNAVDHGIESPEERKANGKSEIGEIQLSAYHSAGSVVVEIKDDGKGLNREGIIAKAKERGLISDSPDFNERSLSDREVYNMVFEAGFSTAEVVTDVSGRGVGMDVVKKNIESLRGQVEIKSEPGKGSVFKMSLPLTLAIIDGMVVRVGHETYVIPTVSILRSIKANPDDICSVFNRGQMVSLQGNLIPLYRMSVLYNISGAKEELTDAIIVVVEDEDRQAGLVIDELIGRQQVVIKTLGETMKEIPGISGGAIMPDGRVGLILDVGGLVRFANLGQDEGFKDELESVNLEAISKPI